MSLNSTTRDHSLSLRQWWDTHYTSLQEQTEFVYTKEITTESGESYIEFSSVDNNVGVRDKVKYINENYDENFVHNKRKNVRIVSIR